MDGAGEGGGAAAMQRIQPPVPNQPNRLDIPSFCSSQFGAQLRPSHSPEGLKRPGIPPSHPNHHHPPSPYSQIPTPPRSAAGSSQNLSLSPGPSHSRSLSQPPFFSLDCLPPLNPLPQREASDVSMEERASNSHNSHSHMSLLPSPGARGGVGAFQAGESLPLRRGHRRSSSDIPLGFNAMIQSSPQLIPIGSRGLSVKSELEWDRNGNGSGNVNNGGEGMGERKGEGEIVDDLFNAYMNLDNLDALNSSGTEDKDMDSRASGTKNNGGENSDNEVESRVNGHSNGHQGLKRSAGSDIAPTSRHYRSVSMDSFIGNLHFDDESSKRSLAGLVGQHSPSNSINGNSAKFNLELANGEFSGEELKKIMANDKLAEIAISDPKRAKRILANRQSAARSKERKMRYIAELEHKVQTLQTEATTLSAQLTMLQRDSTGLTSENNELKFRLQSMEQQAQLKDALNEALGAEVRRLKVAVAEHGGEAHLSNCMAQQLSINQQMYQQVQNQQQPNQHNIYQLQQQQNKQGQQWNSEAAKHERSQ